MRRAAVAAAAVAVGTLAVYLGMTERYQLADPAPLDVTRWERFADADVGWSLLYPDGWRVQEDDGSCPDHAQVLVTNVGADVRHPERESPGFSCTDLWDMRELPDGFVVIELEVPGDVGPGEEGSQRSTPLSLDDAYRGTAHPRLGVPRGLWIPVFLDESHQYFVRVWFGPAASARDRDIAERIVATIRFDLA